MAIPDFESVMLPLLKYTSDRKEHQFRDTVEYLAQEFKLSQEERRSMLPSGSSRVFDNKVGWARFYLVKAVLLESAKRGFLNITQRGLEVLSQKPVRIDTGFLNQFPEYREFKTRLIKGRKEREVGKDKPSVAETPEESIVYGYERIRQELAQQLLNEVLKVSPSFFERPVVDLLVTMGYGGSVRDATEVVGKSGDGGIDGVIKEDRLGLDVIYIQAKRWEDTSIGRPELQKFVGALKGQQANKGIFITTSKFSNEAIDYVSKVDSKVVLIDGEQLAEYMIDNNVGVSTVATYEIKKVDLDYFIED